MAPTFNVITVTRSLIFHLSEKSKSDAENNGGIGTIAEIIYGPIS